MNQNKSLTPFIIDSNSTADIVIYNIPKTFLKLGL